MSGLITIRRRPLRDLWRAREAIIIIEFAYALPVLLLLAFSSLELGNLAISNMRISQIAMTVADNLSRAKQTVALGLPELREVDVNDALLGAKIQGGDNLAVLNSGRVIVSSLQQDVNGKQKIFWQRCKGKKNVGSAYGVQGATQDTTPGFTGMGTGTAKVQAAAGNAVIFAEVDYTYVPLVGTWALGNFVIRREAAFYVRDDRKMSGGPENNGLYNPGGAAKSTCNLYTDTFS